jgi:hypothetical protein
MRGAPPSSDLGDPDLGFPLEQHECVDAGCGDDAFKKVTTSDAAIVRQDRSRSTVFTGRRTPKLAERSAEASKMAPP